MDYLDDFILFDCINIPTDERLICSECEIGVLRPLNDEQMICDVCDCLYVINKEHSVALFQTRRPTFSLISTSP
jgi:hypothetical protein